MKKLVFLLLFAIPLLAFTQKNSEKCDQPRSMVFDLPENADFKVEIIDAWNMTIQPVEGKFTGHCMVELPQKPMTALRFTKIK